MKLRPVYGITAATTDKMFPKFGEPAPDVPLWDAGKSMYLVDQYQAPSGNRSLTYVGICDQLLLEMIVGHFHSWEFINKVRALVYDGETFKVACTMDYEKSVHFNLDEIKESLISPLAGYAISVGGDGHTTLEGIEDEVRKILGRVFSATVEDLDRQGLRSILAYYCMSKSICFDFTKTYLPLTL